MYGKDTKIWVILNLVTPVYRSNKHVLYISCVADVYLPAAKGATSANFKTVFRPQPSTGKLLIKSYYRFLAAYFFLLLLPPPLPLPLRLIRLLRLRRLAILLCPPKTLRHQEREREREKEREKVSTEENVTIKSIHENCMVWYWIKRKRESSFGCKMKRWNTTATHKFTTLALLFTFAKQTRKGFFVYFPTSVFFLSSLFRFLLRFSFFFFLFIFASGCGLYVSLCDKASIYFTPDITERKCKMKLHYLYEKCIATYMHGNRSSNLLGTYE